MLEQDFRALADPCVVNSAVEADYTLSEYLVKHSNRKTQLALKTNHSSHTRLA